MYDFVELSPNSSSRMGSKVDRITPHCVVGQLSAKAVALMFSKPERKASANYIIGKDAEVCLNTLEERRSWCSSSKSNDKRAITIENASDAKAPYAFTDVVYSKLIDLCVDICKRYGKTKLLWISDKESALSYKLEKDEMLLTVHRWFDKTACPGEWMMNHMVDLGGQVTARLLKRDVVNEYPYPYRTLYRGCKGEDVKWLQFELTLRGMILDIDGSFGAKTERTLLNFQYAYMGAEEADGKCGKKTRHALLK